MRMVDIIAQKRNGEALSKEEIQFFIDGVTTGDIPDYQSSALLMAIFWRGMNREETVNLTLAMARSGDSVDLSSIPGIKADKHSTGGVGDKTTLVVAPIVAACGVVVAKMSGRGLGHTGGTVDKLESIPGLRTDLPTDKFVQVARSVGLCVIGQSGNLTPADKKLYALRDVTATVDSIPLIAASIMSKKQAAGADCILLDVKTGSGAFMKTMKESAALAEAMVSIGEDAGRRTAALITDMDRPLGYAIGNALEINESVAVLRGGGPSDLRDISIELAAHMLWQAGKASVDACRAMAEGVIKSGAAFEKLKDMVTAQGGDSRLLEDAGLFEKAAYEHAVLADREGYITAMDTAGCGRAAMLLGAGRETKESLIDYSAGIVLEKKIGDHVRIGDVLATLYCGSESQAGEGSRVLTAAVTIGAAPPPEVPLVKGVVSKEGVRLFV